MTKFEKATLVGQTDEQIDAMVKQLVEAQKTNPTLKASMEGLSVRDIILQQFDEDRREVWMNDLYVVLVLREANLLPAKDSGWPPMIWLSIRRIDREPIRDWRHLQIIKNELVGPEHEAVELFPAESRLVDSANQFHLFVLASDKIHFPFGFVERLVMNNAPVANSKQREFDAEHPKGS